MRKLLLSVLLTSQVFTGISFGFTVYKYNEIADFSCDCNPATCTCQQGDLGMSLKLVHERLKDWGFLYKRYCGSLCVNMISDVSHVKLPYLTMDTIQSAVKQANSLIKNAKSSAGADRESVEVFSRVREKVQQYSQAQSESLRNDLTMYLLTQMARDFYGKTKEERITPAEYAVIINKVLTPLNTEGKLTDFIALYLALKKNGDPQVKDVAYLLNKFLPSKENQELHGVLKLKLDIYKKEGIKFVIRQNNQGEKEIYVYIPGEAFDKIFEISIDPLVFFAFMYSIDLDAAKAFGQNQLPYREVSAVWSGLGELSQYDYLLPLENADEELKNVLKFTGKAFGNENAITSVFDIIVEIQEGDKVITVPVVGLPTSQPVKGKKPSKARRK